MSSETLTIRLPRSLVEMSTDTRIRELLQQRGLDPRTMQCRGDGDFLVYEGWPVTKGNELTKDNRTVME